MRRTLPTLLFAAVVALGCSARLKAPALKDYKLGLSRATYREYGAAGTAALCEAEPRWLFDELTSVNGLLDRFVSSTGAGADQPWTEEGLEMLEVAQESLGPVLAQHEANLSRAARCPFASQRGFPDLLRRGRELSGEGKQRLAEAPAILEQVRTRRALELWKEERPLKQFAARQACPSRARRLPDLYFAYANEQGETLWLFCDGAKVIAPRSGPPEFSFPEGLSRRERARLRPAVYLDAAKRFPGSEVSRAPSGAQTGVSRK